MIPYLTTATDQTVPTSSPSLTTPNITTPELSSTDSENLPSSTVMTTTTTTETSAAVTSDTVLRLFTSWTSSIRSSLENMTAEVSVAGEDVAVDVGGGGGMHTPLNAPQPSLEPVTQSSSSSSGRSADLSELGWIIPISVISLVLMVALALALYYGVRKLELRMLSWCYRNCGCCCAPGGGRGGRLLRGEQYDTLSEETGSSRKETVRLRDMREGSPSYGMTRKVPKEYSPNREPSPSFDDGGS